MKSLLFAYCLLLGTSLFGQVTVEDCPEMNEVVERYSRLFPADEEIEGWSILVALNQDRRKIDEIKNKFTYQNPAFKGDVEWTYESPYYKLIIGAFEDRKSSLPWLAKIRESYPGAFAVKATFPREAIVEFRRKMPL